MVHRRLDIAHPDYRPDYVVWELTLACDQPCTHCGSRAGEARARELTTVEALDVVRQLGALRTREIALIGGEAYLHPGFLEVLDAIRAEKIRATMVTGGRGVTASLAAAMADRGVFSVSVSVDGLRETHDLLRAARGSFDAANAALAHFAAAGITITANTNVNRLNASELEELYGHLRSRGITAWQVQLTAPLGRAADRPELIVQPWQLLDIVPRIAELKRRAYEDGVLLMPGNNLGYFGPEEALLRSVEPDGGDHYHGCVAGRWLLGIESDGAVKGCPSLQTRHYVGGHVRERSIAEVWSDAPQLAFTRRRSPSELWGFCKTCPFAETCLGGCTFTAQALLGRRGNNPYCHFRARSLAARGVRERLVARESAPGEPFDNGRFDLIEERLDAPWAAVDDRRALVKVRRARNGEPLA